MDQDAIGRGGECRPDRDNDYESSSSSMFYGADEAPIFGSDLCGMFEDPRASQTDACAFFCCGVFLWQRNKDMLVLEEEEQQRELEQDENTSAKANAEESRLSLWRFFETACLVLLVVAIAAWSLEDSADGHLFSDVTLISSGMLVLGTVGMIIWFQRSRRSFRKRLAIVEYYRRHGRSAIHKRGDENDHDPELAAFLQAHHREIYGDGAHAFCGCAGSDNGCFGTRLRRQPTGIAANRSGGTDDDNDDDDTTYERGGFCFTAWRFLANACCGVLCGYHLQLCGTCATAQESRHLRDVLPFGMRPGLWQRDYLTMQPWNEYYPSILRLRFPDPPRGEQQQPHQPQAHCLAHFGALSTLSRRILLSVVAFLLFVTGMFLLPVRFPKWEVLILYATLLQPVVFLIFVHWLWNRTDLSLDAVVKYFASGFFICTGCALVYEWFVSQVGQKVLLLLALVFSEGFELFGHIPANGTPSAHSSYFDRPLWYQVAMASLTALINSLFVAAMTEEICKYLCYWMVEHPDLELRNKVILSPTLVLSAEKESASETDGDVDIDTETTGLLSQYRVESSDPEEQFAFAPRASLASIGEAITVAMITVALGFACAENLLYVFVYTPMGFGAQISTFYVRCLFPIHPMAAALQSIGVCRRDLEKDASYGIGWIVFPAWLLHGSFDASLMTYSAIKKILDRHNLVVQDHGFPTAPPGIEPGGGETLDADEGVPFLMYVMAIPFVAMVYFLNESFYQRERLEQMDHENRRRVAT